MSGGIEDKISRYFCREHHNEISSDLAFEKAQVDSIFVFADLLRHNNWRQKFDAHRLVFTLPADDNSDTVKQHIFLYQKSVSDVAK